MAIRSSATNTGASSTSVVGNLPAGTTTGDLLLAFVQIRTRSVTFTPPSGWTEVYHYSSGSGPQATIACFWLAPGGSEPSTYTWTASLAGSSQTLLVALTGMNTTSPVDVSAATFVSTTTSPATPSVTTTAANDVLFCQYATDATTTLTAASGQTIINTPTSQHVVSDSETIASAGATGPRAASGTGLKYVTAASTFFASGAGATAVSTVATQGGVVAPAPTVTVLPGQVAAPVSLQGGSVAVSPVVTGGQPNATVRASVATGSVAGVAPTAAQVASVWFFTPPTTKIHYGRWVTDPLTSRIGIPTGGGLLKRNGFYTLQFTPFTEADIAGADICYIGGHRYTISSTEAAALTAAGYGANITTG